jgi:hypothetical protein
VGVHFTHTTAVAGEMHASRCAYARPNGCPDTRALPEEEAGARLFLFRAQIALATILRACPNINKHRLALVFDLSSSTHHHPPAYIIGLPC